MAPSSSHISIAGASMEFPVARAAEHDDVDKEFLRLRVQCLYATPIEHVVSRGHQQHGAQLLHGGIVKRLREGGLGVGRRRGNDILRAF